MTKKFVLRNYLLLEGIIFVILGIINLKLVVFAAAILVAIMMANFACFAVEAQRSREYVNDSAR